MEFFQVFDGFVQIVLLVWIFCFCENNYMGFVLYLYVIWFIVVGNLIGIYCLWGFVIIVLVVVVDLKYFIISVLIFRIVVCSLCVVIIFLFG